MLNTQEIIDQLESLPVEERAHVVDRLLKTLNPTDPHIDRQWADAAQQRLDEFRSGQVAAIPADEVFDKARERFTQ